MKKVPTETTKSKTQVQSTLNVLHKLVSLQLNLKSKSCIIFHVTSLGVHFSKIFDLLTLSFMYQKKDDN